MTHPLVTQLRFTRSEFKRAVKGVSDEDAAQRILPMNCISWNVGHLAWQEQRYFLYYGQQRELLLPEIDKQFAYGCPASTPSLKAMLKAWATITDAVDPWLDTVTKEVLASHVMKADGTPSERIIGNLLQRVIYHYWYHIGENMAIRQMLGHERLGVFVGNIDDKASYVPQ
jgi:DinB superfamily